MRKLILASLMLMGFSHALASTSGLFDNKQMISNSTLIDGVSQFLIERAETNMLYIFENKIKDNEQFACYFPNTRQRLEYNHLQEWMLFPTAIWKETIEKDIEVFAVRSLVSEVEEKLKLSEKAAELGDVYIRLTKDLAVEFNGQRYPLSGAYLRTDPAFDVINGFSYHLAEIVTALNNFRAYSTKCDSPNKTFAEFEASIAGLVKFKDNIAAFRNHVKKYGKDLRLAPEKLKAFCQSQDLEGDCSTEDKAMKLYIKKLEAELLARYSETKLGVFVKKIEKIKNQFNALVAQAKKETSYTGLVMLLLDDLKNRDILDQTQMQGLSRAALFFAAISDSKKPEQVKTVLEAYTLPAVSYYAKREPGNHVNITAYVGIAHGFYESDIPEPDEKTSVYAPIGLEFSRGLSNRSSLSIMLAPFDLAYPVTQKLNGNDADAELDDIFAPSVSFSYGFPELPLTMGLGYQQGRYITSVNKNENRWLVFIAFDMPLFNFR